MSPYAQGILHIHPSLYSFHNRRQILPNHPPHPPDLIPGKDNVAFLLWYTGPHCPTFIPVLTFLFRPIFSHFRMPTMSKKRPQNFCSGVPPSEASSFKVHNNDDNDNDSSEVNTDPVTSSGISSSGSSSSDDDNEMASGDDRSEYQDKDETAARQIQYLFLNRDI